MGRRVGWAVLGSCVALDHKKLFITVLSGLGDIYFTSIHSFLMMVCGEPAGVPLES